MGKEAVIMYCTKTTKPGTEKRSGWRRQIKKYLAPIYSSELGGQDAERPNIAEGRD